MCGWCTLESCLSTLKVSFQPWPWISRRPGDAWYSWVNVMLSLWFEPVLLPGSSHNDRVKGLGKGTLWFCHSWESWYHRGGRLCLPLLLLIWWCLLWRGTPHLCLGAFELQSGVYTPGWSIQAVSWSSESWGRGDPLLWVETEAVICSFVCWRVSSPWVLFTSMTFQTPLQQIVVECVLYALATGV